MKRITALLLLLLMLAGCTTAPAVETTAPTTEATEATLPVETTEATVPEETEPASILDPNADTFTVHFIDVGQADCMLLECNGIYAVIDGGYDTTGSVTVEYLQQQGVEEIELVIATHPHGDHIGGLPDVFANFPVNNVWSGPITYTNDYVKNFRAGVASQKLTIQFPQPGDTFQLGDAQITVLGPVKKYYEDANDLSLVVMVEFGDTRFLFTGDMEQMAEDDMLDYWGEEYDFSADVLKVGHHGSYSSTHYRFLRAVMPTYGVICVGGNNEYGHPHKDPISRLQDAEVQIYRTDKMYDIVCTSDGTNIEFVWENIYAKPWTPNK